MVMVHFQKSQFSESYYLIINASAPVVNLFDIFVISEAESVFKEEALVEELTSVLREWGAMWKQVYLVILLVWY